MFKHDLPKEKGMYHNIVALFALSPERKEKIEDTVCCVCVNEFLILKL